MSGRAAWLAALFAASLTQAAPRELTFEDRVRAQEAIERVYYAHQIGATKPFEEAVPRSVLEKKVRSMLDRSRALESLAGFVITPPMLEAEKTRIRAHSRMPERLDALFAALGNDPLLIDECLVRPVLIGRLLDGPADPGAEASMAACIPQSWSTTANAGIQARMDHQAVWTGSLMIVWGGSPSANVYLVDGGRYDPALDSWQPVTPAPLQGRYGFSAVWTGQVMVIWGGNGASRFNTGARYDPISDTWQATTTLDAPSARYYHSAVWTGSEMIVFGGYTAANECAPGDGARYDPVADAWNALPAAPSFAKVTSAAAVWTGTEMIVWGGLTAQPDFHGGCLTVPSAGSWRYSPGNNSWLTDSTTGAPSGTASNFAVWTGTRMLALPNDGSGSGRSYDPASDTWAPLSSAGAPMVSSAAGVWTGSALIVWGGFAQSVYQNTGAIYDPIAKSWSSTTTSGAPSGRIRHSGVWTGTEAVFWGGQNGSGALDDGGRFLPGNDFDADDLCPPDDNCPSVSNPTQSNADGDSLGDPCDNCPLVSNASQTDADGDFLGDACDSCPLDATNDGDRDGHCQNVDNCGAVSNRLQRDTDGDGRGDLCDGCPTVADSSQADADGDGSPDACDCEPLDRNDRAPAEISLAANKSINTITFTWAVDSRSDVYLIDRGDLASKGPTEFGACIGTSTVNSFQDATVPAARQGFFYLIRGENFDCGLGSLGFSSDENLRSNSNAAACTGPTVVDVAAAGETPVTGAVTGTYTDNATSNNLYESIQEQILGGVAQLEHRWQFTIPAGSRVELHVEGFRNPVPGESFSFQYSSGGPYQNVTGGAFPFPASDDGTDLIGTVPASVSGPVTIRVIDIDRSASDQLVNTLTIDRMWIRVIQ